MLVKCHEHFFLPLHNADLFYTLSKDIKNVNNVKNI